MSNKVLGLGLLTTLGATAGLIAACGTSDPVELTAAATTCSAPSNEGWISAWGGTRTSGTAPAFATIRNLARVTAGGPMIRLRFFNLNESTPLTIGAASVGIRDGVSGANLVPGSLRTVTFNCGETSATIPPGTGSFYSDPVELPVNAQDDVAVNLFSPTGNPGEFSTEWNNSYVSAPETGDLTAEESGAPFTTTSSSLFALRDVEVLTAEASGAIVFLGSSSFHGSNSTRDAYRRVSDQISRRINDEIPPGEQQTAVNRGIGGDSLGRAFRTRMEQDVWSTVGIETVVVWVTNDLGPAGGSRTADQVIADYLEIIAQAHAKGINVICPTWVPGAQSGASNVNGERDKLNDWILNSGNCDAVVDYNDVVEHETVPNTWKPEYLTDHIHTNDAGHTAWADITPVDQWVALPRPAP